MFKAPWVATFDRIVENFRNAPKTYHIVSNYPRRIAKKLIINLPKKLDVHNLVDLLKNGIFISQSLQKLSTFILIILDHELKFWFDRQFLSVGKANLAIFASFQPP